MTVLLWDQDTKRTYETGVRKVALYVKEADGTYGKGVAWNGVTGITETASGGDENKQYADDIKYLALRGAEDFGANITAFTYPDEFAECDGTANVVEGVSIGQQTRKGFGLCYRTTVGNDAEYDDYGYKLHLIYNATASPSEKQYQTINDSPEAMEFSWEATTTPVDIKTKRKDGSSYRPSATVTINTTTLSKEKKEKVAELEKILYGDEETEPRLPSIDEVLEMFAAEG